MSNPRDILELWFEGWTEDAPLGEGDPCMRRWWAVNPAFDDLLRERFGATNAAARRGELDDWLSGPRTCVALVLVLDQVSRNIFRGSGESFAADEQARTVTRFAIDAGYEAVLPLIYRYFLYMPLMHSEALPDHDLGVERFEALLADAKAAGSARVGAYESALSYMHRHRDVIVKFGRYPHRNEVLGRETTEAEQAHLDDKGRF